MVDRAPLTPTSASTADGETREIQSYMVFGTTFDVDANYTVVDAVGQGAYGIVCAAKDEDTGEMVAIKKITNAFEHHTFAKRTLREITLMRMMQHENIIRLKTILRPLDPNTFDDIYVIAELMETDLSSIIKSPQPLSDRTCSSSCTRSCAVSSTSTRRT